ncbi:MAG: hypothetical protein GF411_05830 [Candidatus Lokiarchaeota archaeon]|nr:hypothetical protein [Candidatus Lokiarchaeota archaeon]
MQKKTITILIGICLILTVPLFANAATTTFEPGYDNGRSGNGMGGDADDYPDDGECRLYMNAVTFPSEAWAWIGSELTFSSTKSVYMDADLTLTGYIGTGLFGDGQLKVYLECVRKSDLSLVWSVRVWEWHESNGGTETWVNQDLSSLQLSDFPKSTSAGTYYFIVKFVFWGSYGGLFQYSSSSSSQGILYVDEISVTY